MKDITTIAMLELIYLCKTIDESCVLLVGQKADR